MTNVVGGRFLQDFIFRNQEIAKTQLKKIYRFSFLPINQNLVSILTMSSWSRRIKTHGLNSSIQVQLPTVKLRSHWGILPCVNSALTSHFLSLIETPWHVHTRRCIGVNARNGYGQGWGQIRFVFANTNTNTNTAYLYLYLIKFQTMYLYLYLYPYLVYLANTFSNTLFSWTVF